MILLTQIHKQLPAVTITITTTVSPPALQQSSDTPKAQHEQAEPVRVIPEEIDGLCPQIGE